MEVNRTICKKCNQIKDRIEDGKYPNGKDKRWRDTDGLLWSGKTCGSCTNLRLKEVMKNKRTKTPEGESDGSESKV